MVTLQDSEAPTITGVPANTSADCGTVPPAPNTVAATDNCDNNVEVILTEVSNPAPCGEELIRTWTATDDCGNTATASQTINVTDGTPPVFANVPFDVTIECSEALPIDEPSVSDDCDPDVDLTFVDTDVPGACPEERIITRTWTATDDCGNTATVSRVITLQDSEAPVLTGVPADITADCGNIPPVPSNITATDNCDTDVDITFEEIANPGACAANQSIMRVWTATDNCGNSVSQTQMITVSDDEAPVFANIPSDVTVECSNIPAPQTPTATDNCDTDVQIDLDESTFAGACPEDYVLIRTWTATDDCGNSTTVSQTLTVQDTEVPVITGVPQNQTVSCDNVPSVPNNVIATDNCDPDVDLTFETQTIAGTCPENYTLVWTWTATDNCGNESTASSEITVVDDEAPVMANIPFDVTIECDQPIPSGLPVATDNCDNDVDITVTESEVPGACPQERIITRMFTATDNCGNSSTASQVVILQDSEAPVISGVPTNTIAECGTIPPAPNTVTATDNCDPDVEITFDESSVPGPCGEILTRTWTATDDCGNTATASQTINVNDSEAPVFGSIDNLTLNCTDPIPTDEPDVTDNCDNDVDLSFTETEVPGACPQERIITRTWTATDDCGNESTATQTITITDSEAPQLVGVPSNITANCSADVPPAPLVTANDDCDTDVEVEMDEVMTGDNCSGTLTRTWTATDDCGNTSSATQVITLGDTEAPTITFINPTLINLSMFDSLDVDCDNIPVFNVGDVEALDNCDDDVDVTFTDIQIGLGNCEIQGYLYLLECKWVATDDCGNESELIIYLKVIDELAPILANVPFDVSIECGDPLPTQTPTATDNCDPDVDIYTSDTQQPGACPSEVVITRVFTAVDDCGNQSTASQVITVQDSNPPTIVGVPGDITVDLTNGGSVPGLPNVTATDICDPDVDLIFTETRDDIDNCSYKLTRTWVAVDDCGNEATESYMITVIDGVNVTIQPRDITLCQGEDIQLTALSNATGLSYSWSSNGGTFDDNTLANPVFTAGTSIGTYQIVLYVEDASGCSGRDTIDVEINGGPRLFANNNGPLCQGQDLQLSAPAGADNYSWTGPNAFISNEQNPLIPAVTMSLAGQYTLQATFGTCTATANTFVEVNDELTTQITSNSPVCEGDTLEIRLSGDGDVFSWEGPNRFTSNDKDLIIPGAMRTLHQGTYNVTVSDGSGCFTELSIDAQIKRPPLPVLTSNSPVCANSKLNLYASGGATFTWTGPNGFVSTEQNPELPNALGLNPGFYTFLVEVISVDGCAAIDSIEIQLTNPVLLDAGDDIAVCIGQDVQFIITSDGDEFLWTGPNNFVSLEENPVLSNAQVTDSGDYILTVTKGGTCEAVDTVHVEVSQGIQYELAIYPEECTQKGYIGLAIIGNSTGFTFDWADLPGVNNPKDRTGLSAGFYTVTITSPAGCELILQDLEIENECICETPNVLGVVAVPSSCGNNEGSATIAVEGNLADFTYDWTPNAGVANSIGNRRSQLPSGVYEVLISRLEPENCDTTIFVTIGNLNGPELDTAIVTGADCNEANGTAELLPLGITYTWLHDNFVGNIRNDLSAGTYQVQMVNPSRPNCPNVVEVIIPQENNLEAYIKVTQQPTCGDANGVVSIEVVNGSGNYTFIWSDDPNINSADRSGLESGLYNVTVVDDGASGCDVTLTFTLANDVSIAEVEIIGDVMVSCAGTSNGFVNFNILYTGNFAAPADTLIRNANGSPVLNGNLAPGAYCIMIMDANGCLAGEECFNVLEPAPLLASAEVNNITCDEDGSILLTVQGGTGAYAFDWADIPGNDDPQNRIGLQEGTYQVVISDANNCTEIITNLVIEDDCNGCRTPAVKNVISLDADCGNSNGQATIEMIGNAADYTYTWAPNFGSPLTQVGNARNNLSAGLYNVTIADKNDPNCFTVESFIINNIDGPQLDELTITPATCNGSNGIVAMLPKFYTYLWMHDGVMSGNRDDLPAGTYEVRIIDPANPTCPTILMITIGTENPLMAEANIRTLPTCGEANGSVQINVTAGGSGQYTYEWSDNPSATTSLRNDLAAGAYQVTVTDTGAFGCETVVTFSLTDDVAGAVVNADDAQVSCYGARDGFVNFTIDKDPSFAGPEVVRIKDQSGNIQTNGLLAPGMYCVIVTDANGCVAGEDCFMVTEPARIQANVTMTDATCDNGGTIILNILGGTQPYNFEWSDILGAGQPQNRTDLPAGNYSVTITDVNGCSEIMTNLVVNDDCQTNCTPPIVGGITTIPSSCGNSTGMVFLDVQGNPFNYTYTWTPNVSTSMTATGLTAGTYKVKIANVSDPNCYTEVTAIVGNNNAPVATVSNLQSATCELANGKASLSPLNYNYQWPDGNTNASRTDLAAGTYGVTVYDANPDCFNVVNVTIESENNLTAQPVLIIQPSCGDDNGSVTIQVDGGSGDYNFSWGAGATKDNLNAGTYVVTVTDNQTGCEADTRFVLVDNVVNAIVTVSNASTSCGGAEDATVQYDVSLPQGFVNPERVEFRDENDNIVQNGSLGAGEYCLLVFDGNGCLAGQACFSVSEPPAILPSVQITNETCSNGGTINLTVVGGGGFYTYDWADMPGTDNPKNRNNLVAGTYDVTITDNQGCSISLNDLVVGNDCQPSCTKPVITASSIGASDCAEANGSINLTIDGNLSDFTFTWSPNVSTSNVASGLAAGNYEVTVARANDPACFTTAIFAVDNANGPTVSIANTQNANCNATDGSASLTPALLTYNWSDNGTGASRNDLAAGTYQVTATDAGGCISIIEVVIGMNSDLTASANINQLPDCGASNGSVTINVNGRNR
ncbi:MAG: hypothetical protein R2784_14075 [Saprospiraceae bacterium]